MYVWANQTCNQDLCKVPFPVVTSNFDRGAFERAHSSPTLTSLSGFYLTYLASQQLGALHLLRKNHGISACKPGVLRRVQAIPMLLHGAVLSRRLWLLQKFRCLLPVRSNAWRENATELSTPVLRLPQAVLVQRVHRSSSLACRCAAAVAEQVEPRWDYA